MPTAAGLARPIMALGASLGSVKENFQSSNVQKLVRTEQHLTERS